MWLRLSMSVLRVKQFMKHFSRVPPLARVEAAAHINLQTNSQECRRRLNEEKLLLLLLHLKLDLFSMIFMLRFSVTLL